MCLQLKPMYIARDYGTERVGVPCGECWQCRNNYINGYIGRALSEAAYSEEVLVLTLTYRDQEDGSHKIVNPKHFQDFIRSVRKTGHNVRYIAAGEYGELRDRAHFHAVLFIKKFPKKTKNSLRYVKQLIKPPQWATEKEKQLAKRNSRSWIDQWPHGHVVGDWRGNEDEAVRYALKYLDKDKKKWFTISKKPIIGIEFIKHKASMHAEMGIMPTSFTYRPPNAPDKQYNWTGAAEREFLLELRRLKPEWFEKFKWGRENEKYSETVRKAIARLYKWEARKYDESDEIELRHPSKEKIDHRIMWDNWHQELENPTRMDWESYLLAVGYTRKKVDIIIANLKRRGEE